MEKIFKLLQEHQSLPAEAFSFLQKALCIKCKTTGQKVGVCKTLMVEHWSRLCGDQGLFTISMCFKTLNENNNCLDDVHTKPDIHQTTSTLKSLVTAISNQEGQHGIMNDSSNLNTTYSITVIVGMRFRVLGHEESVRFAVFAALWDQDSHYLQCSKGQGLAPAWIKISAYGEWSCWSVLGESACSWHKGWETNSSPNWLEECRELLRLN